MCYLGFRTVRYLDREIGFVASHGSGITIYGVMSSIFASDMVLRESYAHWAPQSEAFSELCWKTVCRNETHVIWLSSNLCDGVAVALPVLKCFGLIVFSRYQTAPALSRCTVRLKYNRPPPPNQRR